MMRFKVEFENAKIMDITKELKSADDLDDVFVPLKKKFFGGK